MSLTSILTSAGSALTTAQYRMAVSQINVANVDDTTYSRKTVATTATSSTSTVSNGSISRAADVYLAKAVVTSASAASRDSVLDSYMQSYDASLGSVDGGDDVASLLDSFQTAISGLAADSSSMAAKAQVVSAASAAAQALTSLSGDIQALRTQANTEIASTVDAINASLATLQSLNDQIVTTTAQGGDITTLEDQRAAELVTLSSMIGISSYTTSDNRVAIYTTSGDQLLGASAAKLSYTASSSLSADTLYPASISGVTLNGKDVTTTITSGSLGALITLRDETLVGEQAALDSLAAALIDQVNAVTNSGSAVPAPTTLTSALDVAAADAFSATGSVRLAVTASDGTLVSTQDIDLSAYATIADLATALDAISGLSASVTDGKLVLTADDTANGVALADIDADISGQGFSAYFGFNDLLSGTGASDIAVSETLLDNPSLLATASLDTTQALTVGATVLASGDTAVADGLATALTTDVSFTSAGQLAAGKSSLLDYAASFVSTAATTISAAADQSEASTATADAATTRLANMTAVNLDEELALLEAYEQAYQANAQLVSMVQDLFDALISMVS